MFRYWQKQNRSNSYYEMYPPKPKFKVGDLVRVISFTFFFHDEGVKLGDVGLIVTVEDDCDYVTLWGVDYMVLIRGEIILLFENEIEMFEFD